MRLMGNLVGLTILAVFSTGVLGGLAAVSLASPTLFEDLKEKWNLPDVSISWGEQEQRDPVPTPYPSPSGTPFLDDRVPSRHTDTGTPVTESTENSLLLAEEYFSLLNDDQFETAWATLSDRFKQERQVSYVEFIEYWSQFSSLSFQATRSIDEGSTATVWGFLTRDQEVSQTEVILIRENNRWKIARLNIEKKPGEDLSY